MNKLMTKGSHEAAFTFLPLILPVILRHILEGNTSPHKKLLPLSCALDAGSSFHIVHRTLVNILFKILFFDGLDGIYLRC
jgi:hypothetical protein